MPGWIWPRWLAGFSRPKSRERIETLHLLSTPIRLSRFSRPKSRERIETDYVNYRWRINNVSPGRKAGSGLKHEIRPDRRHRNRFSRPKSRERIETAQFVRRIVGWSGFSRPKSRERIETQGRETRAAMNTVSPGRKAGSGLKRPTQKPMRSQAEFLPAEKPGAD